MKKITISIAVLCCIGLLSCKKENTLQQNTTVKEIPFKYEGDLQFVDTTNTVKKRIQIEIADNDFEHQTGLMYRKHMDTNKGMLFIFDDNDIRVRSFYMKNTYIPLDIIFIDANKRIINIAKNTEPLNEASVFSEAPAKYVLEINAGLSEQWNLTKANYIQFTKK